jgi:4'-phosphopantetheinyl transferase
MTDLVYIENKFPLSSGFIKKAEGLVGNKEKDRASRFRRWQDKQANLLGKGLLAHLLEKHKNSRQLLKNLDYTEFNRPYIPQSQFDFNISHSGELVVCAWSDTHVIGVDIELIQPVEVEDFSYILNTVDRHRINNSIDRYSTFFKIWSAKEAMLKADGCGLIDKLDQLEIHGETGFLKKTKYHLRELQIDSLYSSFIASVNPIETISIEKLCVQDLFRNL